MSLMPFRIFNKLWSGNLYRLKTEIMKTSLWINRIDLASISNVQPKVVLNELPNILEGECILYEWNLPFTREFKLYYLTSAHRNLELIKLKHNLLKYV